MKNIVDIQELHDPSYDEHVGWSIDFARGLGMHGLSAAEDIAVVPYERRGDIDLGGSKAQRGGYNPDTHQIIVLDNEPIDGLERTQATELLAAIVHELAHSATADMQRPIFYQEAFAGFAEQALLKYLVALGKRKTPESIVREQIAGRVISLPGTHRHLDGREQDHAESGRFYTSNGLIAASVFADAGLGSVFDQEPIQGYRSMQLFLERHPHRALIDRLPYATTLSGIVSAVSQIQTARARSYRPIV